MKSENGIDSFNTAARQPKRKKTIVVVVGIVSGICVLAFGVWGYFHFFTEPDYSVSVSEAIAWQNNDINQSYPAGTEVTVTLQNHNQRTLADAEVILDKWTDDCGRNLMIHEVPSTPYRPFQAYQVRLYSSPGGYEGSSAIVAPCVGCCEPEKLAWKLITPVKPAQAAKSMRVEGRIVLLEGSEVKTKRIDDFPLRPGSRFQIGTNEFIVEEVSGENSTEYLNVVLRTADCQTPLKAVRLLDSAGKEIKRHDGWSNQWGLGRNRKVQPAVDEQVVRYVTIAAPYGLKSVTLEIEYWSQVRTREIPFAATVPLERRDAVNDSLGHIGVHPVPLEAWGPKAEGKTGDIFDITLVTSSLERGQYPNMEILLLVKCNKALTIASYDVRLTACRDSVGNDLLGWPVVRSAVREGWGVYREFSCLPDAPKYKTPAFVIETRRLPSKKAKSVIYEGVIRIKVGESPETAEVRDVKLDTQKPFSIGPVEFTFVSHVDDSVRFRTKGDLGLLRSLTVLSSEGQVLGRNTQDTPYHYWNDTYAEYIRGITESQASGRLTVRGNFLSRYKHFLVPFRVRVSLHGEKIGEVRIR